MSFFCQVEDLNTWKAMLSSYVLEGEFFNGSSDFSASLLVNRSSDIPLSRIRINGLGRFERLNKDIKGTDPEVVVLCVQLEGTCTHEQDGRVVESRPGDIVCIDSTRPMGWRFGESFAALLVHIPRALVTATIGGTEHFTGTNIVKEYTLAPLLESFLRSLASQLDELSDEATQRLAQIAMSLSITTLTEALTADLPWGRRVLLLRAQKYIRMQSRNSEITPASVASALKISPRYLQSVFHSAGTTIRDYLLQCRLENAKADLINRSLSSLSIGHIAHRAGFSDLSHFSRSFKDAYGVSPRDLRKSRKVPARKSSDPP